MIALLVARASATPAAAKPSAEARTACKLDTIRNRPAKLHAFLKAMPKGADLHNHLSGAVPTETLIGYAVKDGLCIDATFTATAPPCRPGQRPAADSTATRRSRPRSWGVVDGGLPRGAESGHDHFFATFGKFGLATNRKGDMLAEVAKINPADVGYLETLVSRQGDECAPSPAA